MSDSLNTDLFLLNTFRTTDYRYRNDIVYNVEWNGLKLELKELNIFVGPSFYEKREWRGAWSVVFGVWLRPSYIFHTLH